MVLFNIFQQETRTAWVTSSSLYVTQAILFSINIDFENSINIWLRLLPHSSF